METKGMKDDKPVDFYYTKEEMVRDLLMVTPIAKEDSVLDAGSGKNKVWFKCLEVEKKYECEIEDGCDFYKWNLPVDWVVGNPPFRHNGKNQIWKWIDKASRIAKKGFAFLLNHKVFNTLTPARLETLAQRGFYIHHIRIVSDTRWFGRYYYIVFVKEKADFVSWVKEPF